MPTNFAKHVSVTETAKLLGLTPQAVRDRIRAGSLPGQKDDRGRWRIPPHAVPAASGVSAESQAVDARLATVERQVADLVDARELHIEFVSTLSAERDRYRADAAAAREAAARMNVALAETRDTVRSLLNALDAQSEALTQLLTPGSPADLP
jgi:predicted site-specific integrase-resolvase